MGTWSAGLVRVMVGRTGVGSRSVSVSVGVGNGLGDMKVRGTLLAREKAARWKVGGVMLDAWSHESCQAKAQARRWGF